MVSYENKVLKIYTDGACKGNPGPGAWAFYATIDDVMVSYDCGFEENTTNNQMELTAIIEGLNWAISENYRQIELYTDSSYCCNGINVWLKNWKRNNWTKSDKTEIKNLDLWKTIDSIISNNFITFKIFQIKGHGGNKWNEAADSCAVSCIQENLDKNKKVCYNKEESKDKKESIDHPSHYNIGTIEVIDLIDSLNIGFDFSLGNIIKYLSRAPYKGHEYEDLNKAKWYLNHCIELLQQKKDIEPITLLYWNMTKVFEFVHDWSLSEEIIEIYRLITDKITLDNYLKAMTILDNKLSLF